ncbi:helix-turn-helix domain-containing protein [Salinimicrobium sp. GXAS 041]|uniref:helix-turn-helix domain-containing protein n=1 Tax=Salinimicrobium sp. GXAS 041 TaxID=3400806 RepID=UPI003C77570F
MRITVKALPVHDVLKDIAKQWNVSIKEDSGELSIALPKDLGEGYIRCTNFESGIGVIEYNCTFSEDYQFLFSINETHPLKFIFCSEGTADHCFEEEDTQHKIDTYQNVIVSSSGNNGHLLSFTANQKAHITSIEIVRSTFSRRNNHHFHGLEPTLKALFEDSVAEKLFFYQGNYSLKAADIVDDISNKKYHGFVRSIHLESKLLDMLVLQINQYHDDQREDNQPQILRRFDVDKVERAANHINDNLQENYSVEELAKEVGTNVNKLQQGFRYMYDLTVNKYNQQVKLEKARDLLETSNHNISEIVNMIGFSNRSYFSKIFKEKYGVSPKYFLQSYKEAGGEDGEN